MRERERVTGRACVARMTGRACTHSLTRTQGRKVGTIQVDEQGFNIFGDTDAKLSASYVSRL
jgi:hypothetical protein